MFGVSFPELIIVFMVILILFGPDKLPGLARSLGKLSGTFRKSSDALRREFYNAIYTPADELKKDMNQVSRDLRALAAFPEQTLTPTAGAGGACDCPEHQPQPSSGITGMRPMDVLMKLSPYELNCDEKAALERERKRLRESPSDSHGISAKSD